MVQIPHFPECKHSLVKSLAHHTDQALLTLFQRKPESGQYFLAIFCRYSPIVYTLIQHSARSPVQAHYLFALTWRHIYHELRGLTLHAAHETHSLSSSSPHPSARSMDKPMEPSPSIEAQNWKQSWKGEQEVSDRVEQPLTLQTWLINITAVCINTAQLPSTESIHYSLEKASPPLWCYLEQSLGQLPPTHRLVILLSQTFHWSKSRISAYLQAEGEALSTDDLTQVLQTGYRMLTERLPEDIQTIYLSELASLPSSPTAAVVLPFSSDDSTIVATSD